jgi:hypothetical protein
MDMSVKTPDNWLDVSHTARPLSSPSRKPGARAGPAAGRECHTQDGARNPKKSDGVLRQEVQARYALIACEQARYPIRMLCRQYIVLEDTLEQ